MALVAGAVLLLAFGFWARGRPAAALDLTLFEDRSFLFVNLATAVFGIAFTAMFLSSFLFLMGVWGYSQGLAGWAVTPGPLLVIPVAILSGRLAGRVGHRPLLVGGGVLYAAAQAWLCLRIGSAPAYVATWLPGQLLGGTAIGLVLPALSGAAVAKLGPTRFGVGGGVNNALRQFGGAAGAALAVALVGRAGASLQQFQHLYAVLSALGLLTALLCLPVQTRLTPVAATPAAAAP
jgi:MFS family permease